MILIASCVEEQMLAQRLTELRGSLHEFDATHGLLVTPGTIGASACEAAAVPDAPAIMLWDGMELATRMEKIGLGYRVLSLSVSFVDTDFFENK